MAGFGSGPFGYDPFGYAAWARETLWENIPELYRSQDTNHLLQLMMEGMALAFDYQRQKIDRFTDLVDPFEVRSQYDEVVRLKLGKRLEPQGDVVQSGLDGRVDALGQFVAPSGRFRETEVGLQLTVRGSLVAGNNRIVQITSAQSLDTVLTDPVLATDIGPLRWEMREAVESSDDYITLELRGGSVEDITPGWLLSDGTADFTIIARRQFSPGGTQVYQTEREGDDGTIDANRLFSSAGGAFTPDDVGKALTLSASRHDANNAKVEITDVDLTTSPPKVSLAGAFLVEDAGPLTWAVLPRAQIDIDSRAIPLGVVEQEGVDLSVAVGSTVSTPTGLFSSEDVGKFLTLMGSLNGQNGEFEILSVPGVNDLVLDTTFTVVESGLYWELRTRTATTTVERSGEGATVYLTDSPSVGQCVVLVPNGQLDPSAIGLTFRLSASSISGNNGDFVVLDVLDDETVVLDSALTVDDGPLVWELIGPSQVKVEARAESLLKFLAPNFGVEIDLQESEKRQRSFVGHINAWLDLKGHETGYEVLGSISGFDVNVFPVYHVDPLFAATIPQANLYEVGEDDPNLTGGNGALTLVGTSVLLASETADFRPAHEGYLVRVTNAVDSGDEGIFEILDYIDAHTVRLDVSPSAYLISTLADYGAGGTSTDPKIAWTVVRYYTDMAPTFPNYDEINSDLMTEYVDSVLPVGDVFGVDRPCWDEDFAAFVNVTINSVTNTGGNTYRLNVTGQLDVIPRDPSGPTVQRLDGALWALEATSITATDERYVLETVPEDVGGGDYEFEVVSDPTNTPATGAGVVRYQCHTNWICSYCPASVVIAVIEIGDIANESGVAVERVLERVLTRLKQQAKPIHVRLVPIFKQTLQADLTITADLEANLEIAPILYAPLTASFDDIPADVMPADITEGADIDATRVVWGLGDS